MLALMLVQYSPYNFMTKDVGNILYLIAHINILECYNKNQHLAKCFSNFTHNFVYIHTIKTNLSCHICNMLPKPMQNFLKLDSSLTCYHPLLTARSCPSFPLLKKYLFKTKLSPMDFSNWLNVVVVLSYNT